MRVPFNWLKELVPVEAPVEEVAEKLTFSGTEVEEIEIVGAPGRDVVVGRVAEISPHPTDNRLKVCRVEAGAGELLQVVCGAPNVRVGARYLLVKAGGCLPTGREVGVEEFGGVRSEGMLCAEDELGLSADHAELLEVDEGVSVGTAFADVFRPEPVLKLEVTPNRGDCLSVLGIAREVAALYGLKVRYPEVDLEEAAEPVEEQVQVRIEDEAGCPRYTARMLTEVSIGRSPLWLRRRLVLAGLRPINNMVDVTNYVLLECGHPLHAFDFDRLGSGTVVVRRARPAEHIVTIDGEKRDLSDEILVIAAGERPVAVAGIMGGQETEIHDGTRRVLLESAHFDPIRIRRGRKKLGLSTESSYRFERYVDVDRVEWASRRAAHLAQRVCGARVLRGVVDVYPWPRLPSVIKCRPERVRRLTGLEAGDEEMVRVFEALGMKVKRGEGLLEVRVPTYRADVLREVDLVEEFARVYGLDRVPVREPQIRFVVGGRPRFEAVGELRRILVGLGLQEVMHYSLVSRALLDEMDPGAESERIVLSNPISAEQAVLRTSLLPQMVETLALNASRQIEQAAFFEMGKVYRRRGEKNEEEERIALGIWGPVGRHRFERRRKIEPEEVFLWLKGVVEELLVVLGIEGVDMEETFGVLWQPGASARVMVGGDEIGVLGLLQEEIISDRRLEPAAAVAELRVEPLLKGVGAAVAYRPVAQYPAVRRDISFVVPETVKHKDVVGIIRRVSPQELARVEIFDIFRSESLGRGKKSMAYSLEYRSRERTLTDAEVNRWFSQVAEALHRELGAVIREGPET